MKRIFLEGLPGAGKSTLLNELERRNLPVVHELGKTLGVDAFPGNGSSVEEILEIDEWFIAQEKARMMGVEAVFDRSYLTHLTYAYGYGQYMGLQSFRPTVDRYENAISTEELSLPSAVVYLDVNPDISIERQRLRSSMGVAALDSFWEDRRYLSSLHTAYDAILDSCEGMSIFRYDGSGDTASLADEVEKTVLSHFEDDSRTRAELKLGRYVMRLQG